MKKISPLKSFLFLIGKNNCIIAAVTFVAITAVLIFCGIKQCTQYSSLKENNNKKEIEQNSWINKEQEINNNFRTIVDNILHREKVDQVKLLKFVSDAAKSLSLKYSVGMPETVSYQFFSLNKISIDFNDIYFSDILKFDNTVESQDYNICIDDMTLTLQGNKLSAKICISALDIKSDLDVDRMVANILNSHNLNEKLIMWNGNKNLVE